jgi:hypothetical protein
MTLLVCATKRLTMRDLSGWQLVGFILVLIVAAVLIAKRRK